MFLQFVKVTKLVVSHFPECVSPLIVASSIYTHFLQTGINTTYTAVAWALLKMPARAIIISGFSFLFFVKIIQLICEFGLRKFWFHEKKKKKGKVQFYKVRQGSKKRRDPGEVLMRQQWNVKHCITVKRQTDHVKVLDSITQHVKFFGLFFCFFTHRHLKT